MPKHLSRLGPKRMHEMGLVAGNEPDSKETRDDNVSASKPRNR